MVFGIVCFLLFVVFAGLSFLRGKRLWEMISSGPGNMAATEYYVRVALRSIFFVSLLGLSILCLVGLFYGPGAFLKSWLIGKIMPSWMTGGMEAIPAPVKEPMGIFKKFPFGR